MMLSLSLVCSDIARSAAFYQNLLSPFGREVYVNTSTGFISLDFFYNVGLNLNADAWPPAHQEYHFHGVDAGEMHDFLASTLPHDDDQAQPLRPGHYRGPVASTEGEWLVFSDPDGIQFHLHQPTAATSLATLAATTVVLTPPDLAQHR